MTNYFIIIFSRLSELVQIYPVFLWSRGVLKCVYVGGFMLLCYLALKAQMIQPRIYTLTPTRIYITYTTTNNNKTKATAT